MTFLLQPQEHYFLFFPGSEKDFYLAGGTALALQIAHRQSIDFDLFSNRPIVSTLLGEAEKELADNPLEILLRNGAELTINASGVKVTFLHYPFPPVLLGRERFVDRYRIKFEQDHDTFESAPLPEP